MRAICSGDTTAWVGPFNFTTLADSTVNIFTNEISELTIYPNPTHGIFYVDFSEINEDVEMIVSSLNGQEVLKQMLKNKHNTISIPTLKPGIYL